MNTATYVEEDIDAFPPGGGIGEVGNVAVSGSTPVLLKPND